MGYSFLLTQRNIISSLFNEIFKPSNSMEDSFLLTQWNILSSLFNGIFPPSYSIEDSFLLTQRNFLSSLLNGMFSTPYLTEYFLYLKKDLLLFISSSYPMKMLFQFNNKIFCSIIYILFITLLNIACSIFSENIHYS